MAKSADPGRAEAVGLNHSLTAVGAGEGGGVLSEEEPDKPAQGAHLGAGRPCRDGSWRPLVPPGLLEHQFFILLSIE